jgi:hypothetical protein
MSTTLDGQKLFDENQLKIEVGSFRRESIEKAAPMLDGVISIDLGRRSRTIKQTGSLLRTEILIRLSLRAASIKTCEWILSS